MPMGNDALIAILAGRMDLLQTSLLLGCAVSPFDKGRIQLGTKRSIIELLNRAEELSAKAIAMVGPPGLEPGTNGL